MSKDIAHWTATAEDWIAWVRKPGFDAFWAYRDAFARWVGPGPGRAADIGCGEGRHARLLSELGWEVDAIEPAPPLLSAAEAAGSAARYHAAPATALPLADGAADLALLYNCLMDIEAAEAAVAEARRVMAPGARMLISIVHPMADLSHDAALMRAGRADGLTYLDARPFRDVVERQGMRMDFAGWSRPISFYAEALLAAGLTIARVEEPMASSDPAFDRQAKWRRLPLFLWLEARA